jgi:DNA polymerase-3 subunit gamma/tau
VVSVLQRVAIAQSLPDAIDDSYGDREAVLALAAAMSAEDIQLYYQIALLGRRDLPLSPEPRGGFEMVMLRMLAFRPGAAVVAETATAAPRPKVQAAAAKPATPAARLAPASAPAPAAAGSEWSAVIAALSLKGMAREMSLNCVFHGIDGDVVKLSLDPAHTHLLGKARVEQLESALCDYYQRTVQVRVDTAASLAAETPAAKKKREQAERQRRAEESIEQDENIRALQDAFGGTVNQGTIRPRSD